MRVPWVFLLAENNLVPEILKRAIIEVWFLGLNSCLQMESLFEFLPAFDGRKLVRTILSRQRSEAENGRIAIRNISSWCKTVVLKT